ncbi:hypothetical protein Peur_016397 [Populus x canadensis]
MVKRPGCIQLNKSLKRFVKAGERDEIDHIVTAMQCSVAFSHILIPNLCHESQGFTASMIKIFFQRGGGGTQTLSVPAVGSGGGPRCRLLPEPMYNVTDKEQPSPILQVYCEEPSKKAASRNSRPGANAMPCPASLVQQLCWQWKGKPVKLRKKNSWSWRRRRFSKEETGWFVFLNLIVAIQDSASVHMNRVDR